MFALFRVVFIFSGLYLDATRGMNVVQNRVEILVAGNLKVLVVDRVTEQHKGMTVILAVFLLLLKFHCSLLMLWNKFIYPSIKYIKYQ